MLRFSGQGVSDVGLVRPHNEDAGFLGPYVALVADGVGGAAAGEVASATTAYAVSATALARFGDDPGEIIRRGVGHALMSLRLGVEEDVSRAGMATTLTMLVCDGSRVLLGHVGDSRAYLLREGHLRQVSTDHTYVQHLVDTGRLAREGVRTHPWRNVVMRSLDGNVHGDPVEADIVDLDARAGDRFLLCSDGLTDLVSDDEIGTGLLVEDPHSSAAALTQAALQAGGRDNITCLVLDVVEGPLVVGDGQVLGTLRDFANIVDPAAVRS